MGLRFRIAAVETVLCIFGGAVVGAVVVGLWAWEGRGRGMRRVGGIVMGLMLMVVDGRLEVVCVLWVWSGGL